MSRSTIRSRLPVLVVIVCSVAVAVVVVVGLQRVLQNYDTELGLSVLRATPRTIPVPMLKADMGRGTVLTEDHVHMVETGAAYVHPDALLQLHEVVGSTVAQRILANEPIRPERLSAPGAGRGLSAIIPEQGRALALNLKDGEAVSGFIEPGDGVDLLVTFPRDGDRATETVTLVQGAQVLAVDEKISETADGEKVTKPQVTLTVPPDVVERVTHAVAVGVPKLSLRAEVDMHHSETHGVMGDPLLGQATDRMSIALFEATFDADAVQHMVEVVHGSKSRIETHTVDPHLLRPIAPVEPVTLE